MLQKSIARMAAMPNELIGAAGRRYKFKELLQERQISGRVWLATSGHDRFILKDIPEDIFSNFNERIRPQLHEGINIRLPLDAIPDQRIFVYKYLTDDFLSLVRKQISIQSRKRILRDSLRGIAELHDQGIVHLDIKPNNIMVTCNYTNQETTIEQVQVTDLENAAHLPKGRCIKGMLAGNDNWRSPEAHFKGELNKPTDMLSFGIMCIYAVLGRVILGPDDDFQKHVAQGALSYLIRLQRQVSYFGILEGVQGLLKHIGDDGTNCQVLQMLWEDRHEEYIPYKPFSEWTDVTDVTDVVLMDLIRGLTNLDPAKRITAAEALEHLWFKDVHD